MRDRSAQRIQDQRWWTLGVLCLSLLVIVVDNTIVNVALPTLVRELHATTTQLQWVVDAYTLALAGLLLTLGSLGDRLGRHRTLAARARRLWDRVGPGRFLGNRRSAHRLSGPDGHRRRRGHARHPVDPHQRLP